MSERRTSVPPRHQATLEALQLDRTPRTYEVGTALIAPGICSECHGPIDQNDECRCDQDTLVGIPAPLHLPADSRWGCHLCPGTDSEDTVVVSDPDAPIESGCRPRR